MNARIKGLPEKLVPIYNAFVDTCNQNGLTFNDIKVDIGETPDGIDGLKIEMELPLGLTDERANEIFGSFIKKYPKNYLTYNISQQSTLEKLLRTKSQTVITVTDGFKLERIS